MANKNKPGKKPRCEICRTLGNVSLAPDPYMVEIKDNHTPRHLCDKCRAEQREAV